MPHWFSAIHLLDSSSSFQVKAARDSFSSAETLIKLWLMFQNLSSEPGWEWGGIVIFIYKAPLTLSLSGLPSSYNQYFSLSQKVKPRLPFRFLASTYAFVWMGILQIKILSGILLRNKKERSGVLSHGNHASISKELC